MHTQKRNGYLFVAITVCLWGIVGVLGRLVFSMGVEPFNLSILRVAICSVLILLGLVLFKRKLLIIEKKDIFFFAIFGLIGVSIFNILYFYAIKLTSVAMAFILLYTAPVFVMLFSAVFLGEKFTGGKIIALILAILGCCAVAKVYNYFELRLNVPGILTGLGAGLTYAFYTVAGKWSTKKYSPWTTTFYSFAWGTLFLLGFQAFRNHFIYNYHPRAWLLIFTIAIACTLLPYVFFNAALSLLEASQVSIGATMVPVIAATTAWLFLKEKLNLVQVLGGICVLIAIIIVSMSGNGKNSSPNEMY